MDKIKFIKVKKVKGIKKSQRKDMVILDVKHRDNLHSIEIFTKQGAFRSLGRKKKKTLKKALKVYKKFYKMNNPNLSIVATCYNDAKIITLLVEQIEKNVATIKNITYEIILVNDFSKDDTEFVIAQTCKNNKNVKGINLSRNFGQQIAMSVGIRYASGKSVLIMDGDLQNPPEAIPLLYNEIQKGYDVVYATSKTRNDFLTKLTSQLFWIILTKILNVKIVKHQLMMKIMDRAFVEKYNLYTEINRTVSGIVNDISQKYSIIEVENNKRESGKSNYNIFKRFNLMIDIIIDLSVAPLNFMIYVGFAILIVTTISAFYFMIQFIFNHVPPGYTSLILSIFFFSSIIIILLSFIGRYLSNIYKEVKNRPFYHISNKINF